MAIKLWKVLSWNVRGINSEKKWNSVRDRISENNCDVVCLQETKRSHIDISFLHNFCSPQYDCFEFLPSNGDLEALLFFGKALSSLDPSSSRMILLLLCSLLQFIIMLHGF